MLQYSLALLAVIALTPLRAQSTPTARRLRPGVAGEIPVGITVDSLYTIVGRERTRLVDLQQEGYFTPVIEIRSQAGGSRAMQAHIAATACGFLISRVDVFDPTYRTESGLHVGMTLADVRSRHSVELSAEEGAHALVAVLGMALELSSDSGADSTRVIAIRVDGPAVAELCRRPVLGTHRFTVARHGYARATFTVPIERGCRTDLEVYIGMDALGIDPPPPTPARAVATLCPAAVDRRP